LSISPKFQIKSLSLEKLSYDQTGAYFVYAQHKLLAIQTFVSFFTKYLVKN